MIIIPVILLVLAIAVGVVAGLAWTAKLPGNDWVGIRAPEARKSREYWDITHRIAGPSWAVSAVALLAASVLGFMAARPEASGWLWLWVVVAVLLSLAFVGVGAAMGANAIAAYDVRVKALEDQAGGSCCSSRDSSDPAAPAGAGGTGDGCGGGGTGACGGDCDSCANNGVDTDALRRAAERSGGDAR